MGAELEEWQNKYNFTDLNFQDETFFTYRDRSLEIAEEILQRELSFTWAATMRADQAHRLSESDFKTLRRSGLRRLLIGVESGTQEMMDWMKKDIKIEHVWEAAERCKSLGLSAIFPFIVGFPNETKEAFEASLRMAQQLRSMSPRFTTPVFYFQPYPGSAITQSVEAEGFELPKTVEEWANFDYVGSKGAWITEEQFRTVERFKFYNTVAGRRSRAIELPVRALARWRMKKHRFGFPFEKKLASWVRPTKALS